MSDTIILMCVHNFLNLNLNFKCPFPFQVIITSRSFITLSRCLENLHTTLISLIIGTLREWIIKSLFAFLNEKSLYHFISQFASLCRSLCQKTGKGRSTIAVIDNYKDHYKLHKILMKKSIFSALLGLRVESRRFDNKTRRIFINQRNDPPRYPWVDVTYKLEITWKWLSVEHVRASYIYL